MNPENQQSEKKFSLTGMKNTVINFVSNQLFRFDRKYIAAKMVEPVNNYFKTPEQMEHDFSLEMGTPFNLFKEKTAEDIYLLAIHNSENKDGYLNTPDPVNINSGFMEENY